MYEEFMRFVRDLYGTGDLIPLHEPRFGGNEKQYLLETIDSTFVSSMGEYVDVFEAKMAEFTGVDYAADMANTDWLFQRLVNVPSGVILGV